MLTGHFSTPCESKYHRSATEIQIQPKPWNLTHCNPTKLKVNSAIRVESFRPLMEGVPAHLAVCGISSNHALLFQANRGLIQVWRPTVEKASTRCLSSPPVGAAGCVKDSGILCRVPVALGPNPCGVSGFVWGWAQGCEELFKLCNVGIEVDVDEELRVQE